MFRSLHTNRSRPVLRAVINTRQDADDGKVTALSLVFNAGVARMVPQVLDYYV